MLCRNAFLVLVGTCLILTEGTLVSAQPLRPTTPPAPASQSDSALKEQILNSPQWLQAMRNLDEWLSVQKLYDAQEVKALRKQMDSKIAASSGTQLADFLADLQQKLIILNGQEARDARKWLGETLAVAAPAYAKKVVAKLPDVAHLTAAQLQEQLDEFEDRQAQTIRSSNAFEKQREERARIVERQQQEADADRQRALDRAAADAANANTGNNPSPQRRFPLYPSPGPFGGGYPFFYGGYRW